MTARQSIAIVGGGLAGLRAAERLRELGYAGTLTMVGEERHAPYNRLPLSKQILEHKLHPDDLGFTTYVDLDVEARSGVRAMRLDPGTRQVVLDTGEALAYDGLVIATGVSARQLPDGPNDDERVLTLRTVDDAVALDSILTKARRLLIVGGGFIGCEVASTARRRAIDVTIVDLAPLLLGRIVGPALGSMITDIYTDAGVDVRLGRSIVGWRTGRRSVTARLDDGNEVAADAVLIAIGTAPRVDWLADLPLDLRDGVLCSATCHVIGLDNVVAAGDVARWPNARFGGDARRVEHWINAVEHGRAAAESLLAGPTAAKPFTPFRASGLNSTEFASRPSAYRRSPTESPWRKDRWSLDALSPRASTANAWSVRSASTVRRAMLRYAAMVDQMTTFTGPLRPPLALPPPALTPPALLPPDPKPVDRRPLAPVFAVARSTGPIPIQRL